MFWYIDPFSNFLDVTMEKSFTFIKFTLKIRNVGLIIPPNNYYKAAGIHEQMSVKIEMAFFRNVSIIFLSDKNKNLGHNSIPC